MNTTERIYNLFPQKSFHLLTQIIFKEPIKARSNRLNMLLKHYQTLFDATCLTRLNGTIRHVGRCWTMLDKGWLFKLFIQHFRSRDQKYAIMSCLVLKFNIVGWCWICLNTPASNTIQHWPYTVQRHLTMLDNVWPTCFILLNGP